MTRFEQVADIDENKQTIEIRLNNEIKNIERTLFDYKLVFNKSNNFYNESYLELLLDILNNFKLLLSGNNNAFLDLNELLIKNNSFFSNTNIEKIYNHDYVNIYSKLKTYITDNAFRVELGNTLNIDEKLLEEQLIFFINFVKTSFIYLGIAYKDNINLNNFLADLKKCIESNKNTIFTFKENGENSYKDVKIDFNSDSVEDIKINPGYLSYLIMNIIINAVKHGNANEIIVKLEKSSEEGNVNIIISDNGTGIDESKFENINDIFKKGVTSGNGTGIGIGDSKEILAKFNSMIIVENNSGLYNNKNGNKGAKFILSFNSKNPIINTAILKDKVYELLVNF